MVEVKGFPSAPSAADGPPDFQRTGQTHTHVIGDYVLEPSVVFTPRSFFQDRFQPASDVIQLPERIKPGGEIRATFKGLGDVLPANPRKGLRLIKDRLKGQKRDATIEVLNRYVVDLRINSPQNWAHLLNFHIPHLAFVETQLEIPLHRLTAIFPFEMPSFCRMALSILGIDAVFTDGVVRGHQIDIYPSHDSAYRANTRSWFLLSEMSKAKERAEHDISVPHRVLIGRRGSRGLVDQERYVSLLAPLGFTTVYPEDLSVAQQFAIFSKSETVVAVHGAGLGPLLLRSELGYAPLNIVGIIPSAVASDFFRMVCQLTGSRWAGIRSKIRPEYVSMAYDMQRPSMTGFEDHDIEIDEDALMMALDHVWNSNDHRIAPTKQFSSDNIVVPSGR